MYNYICYYCLDYVTDLSSNMTKYFQRKNKCKCSTLISYEEAEILSKKNKYIFNINTDSLSKDDYLYIVNHYYDEKNVINENFRKNSKQNKNETENKIESSFICEKCNVSFSKKYNLQRHQMKDICKKNEVYQSIKNEKNNYNNIIEESNQNYDDVEYIENIETTENSIIEEPLFKIIGFSNIEITDNNIIEDFNKEFDISHIKDDFYIQKDFYLYNNFFRMIMKNKKNHNIYIEDDKAIIYTNNDLIKINADKAIYLILDKLNKTINLLLNKQNEETRNYYQYINNYYHHIKYMYREDSMFENYDIHEKKFIDISNINLFKSRDLFFVKIVNSILDFKHITRENLKLTVKKVNDIPFCNINIKGYSSIRKYYEI